MYIVHCTYVYVCIICDFYTEIPSKLAVTRSKEEEEEEKEEVWCCSI